MFGGILCENWASRIQILRHSSPCLGGFVAFSMFYGRLPQMSYFGSTDILIARFGCNQLSSACFTALDDLSASSMADRRASTLGETTNCLLISPSTDKRLLSISRWTAC